ncbi:MAG TPA: LuxR C-terminal-related transcriptional regulator [Opitutaceae bacterium]|nr:LuxR C-terminal-related transcriptional regulator [Opitutaceae bacterium]
MTTRAALSRADGIMGGVSRFRRALTAFFKLLSNREIFLLPYFARGASDSEIASSVDLSPATVHSHRQSITRKLDLHSSVELMRWCAEHGFAHFPRRPLALPRRPASSTLPEPP